MGGSDPVQQVKHAPEESAAGSNNFSCMVEDPDQRFEVPPTAGFTISPLLKEHLQTPQLLRRKAELAGDRVDLDTEKGKAGRGALALVPRNGHPQRGACLVEQRKTLRTFW